MAGASVEFSNKDKVSVISFQGLSWLEKLEKIDTSSTP